MGEARKDALRLNLDHKLKLEFMKGRAVKICAKAGIGRKVRHKKRVFMHIFRKIASEKKILGRQGEYGKIIDVVRRKLCLLSV